MEKPWVVVVDENEQAMRLASTQIEQWVTANDLQVAPFMSAEQALSFVADKGAAVAFVLTDQVLTGMTGSQLIRRTREHAPDAVGIVASSDPDVHSGKCPDPSVVQNVLAKPWDGSKLKEALDAGFASWSLRQRSAQVEQRAQEDLKSALHFQQELLNVQLPDIAGLALYLHHRPSEERLVGGDYFDFFRLSPTRLLLCFGDVAGHGLTPAFIAAVLKNIVYHEHVRLFDPKMLDPARLLNWLNERMVGFFGKFPDLFLSFCATVVDTREMAVSYANAGQPPLCLVGKNDVQTVTGQGIPLGIHSEVTYDTNTMKLSAGNQLVWVSDGVFALELGGPYESMAKPQVLFQQRDKLHEPAGVVDTILANRADPSAKPDDMTLIAARVL